MTHAYQLAPGALYQRHKPETDPVYLRFVRGQPCAVCQVDRNIETAHTGPRGLGTRSDDRSVIPLCRKHHQGCNQSLHALGPVKFEEYWKISIAEVRGALNYEYDQLSAKRKPIR